MFLKENLCVWWVHSYNCDLLSVEAELGCDLLLLEAPNEISDFIY